MKRQLLLLILGLIVISGCKNIEKMVEKGQYDEAILYAAEKLQGEEHKKTKYVRALEDAFHRVMQEDLDRIDQMEAYERAEFYGKIYNLYQKIERRQKRIRPFLPLKSEDGYLATFKMIDPRPYLKLYAEKDSDYHYHKALDLIERYTPDHKELAREAFRELEAIDRYFADYKEVRYWKEKARELGKEYVLLTASVPQHIYLDEAAYHAFMDINPANLDRTWIEFHRTKYDGRSYDYEVVLEVEDIFIGREREVVNAFHYEREVKDGWQYVLDQNGNVAKDSLGNDIKEPRMITARARVTEVQRQKDAHLIGSISMIDLRSNRPNDRIPVEANIDFGGFSCVLEGDPRALPQPQRHRMDRYLESFPTDGEMIYNGISKMKETMLKKINKTFS